MNLRRRLAIGVSVIVSAAVIGVGAVAVLTLRDEVVSLSNSQAANALAAFEYWYTKADRISPPAGAGLGSYPGEVRGTVVAVLRDGAAEFSAVYGGAEPDPASADVLRSLETIDWRDGGPKTVRLAELGPHRVVSRDLGGGERLVSGVSLEDANRTLARNSLLVVVLAAAALLAAALSTVALVRRALRPLHRVAAIAEHVATLPLEADEYRITARVGERDTDPETEVGVVGHTLNQMLDNVDSALTRMAESDRHMKQFLSDASHELRTPLAAILGYAELTRQESEMIPPMTDYALDRIEAESRRMSTLVADLLLLSRLDEGQDLHLESVDVCDLVADAVNDAAVSAPDHRFVADLPEHPVWVRGDRVRLQQVVANLLTNARIHTPEGVTVTAAVAGPRGTPSAVEVTITDDGPGIPAAILPHLFGRFVRADKARSREMGSSGLGLAIVASIVEAHAGTVSAESVPGRTVFTVRLPAAEAGGDRPGVATGELRVLPRE
ncbi:MAG: sensor histidine kinase [Mycobacterium sp.]